MNGINHANDVSANINKYLQNFKKTMTTKYIKTTLKIAQRNLATNRYRDALQAIEIAYELSVETQDFSDLNNFIKLFTLEQLKFLRREVALAQNSVSSKVANLISRCSPNVACYTHHHNDVFKKPLLQTELQDYQNRHLLKPATDSSKPRIILVAGPESSGTRVLAATLALHPDIFGPQQNHEDPLDTFWANKTEDLPQVLTLTRRSLPSGIALDKAEKK